MHKFLAKKTERMIDDAFRRALSFSCVNDKESGLEYVIECWTELQ